VSGLLTLTIFAQAPVTRKLGSFERLVAGDKIIVKLVKADAESAEIRVQGIDASAVKTELDGKTLRLSVVGEPFTKKKVMVTINFTRLSHIEVNNGAEVTTATLFKSDSLQVDLKSGGMLYLDADIKKLSGRIIEGGLLTAEGYADDLVMNVTSTGTLSAFDLECDRAWIKTSTGGKAKINVAEELNAEALSKGYISFKGEPGKITRNSSSGGTITVYEP
jgi:hypothetical protein